MSKLKFLLPIFLIIISLSSIFFLAPRSRMQEMATYIGLAFPGSAASIEPRSISPPSIKIEYPDDIFVDHAFSIKALVIFPEINDDMPAWEKSVQEWIRIDGNFYLKLSVQGAEITPETPLPLFEGENSWLVLPTRSGNLIGSVQPENISIPKSVLPEDVELFHHNLLVRGETFVFQVRANTLLKMIRDAIIYFFAPIFTLGGLLALIKEVRGAIPRKEKPKSRLILPD